MQQTKIQSEEKKILEEITKEEPFNFYIIDEEKGIVYHRNLDFEMGIGNLYEILGKLDAEIIAIHKKEMNPDYIKFIDENNREGMLEAINTGWAPALPRMFSKNIYKLN